MISVILPTYNRERTILRAVRSVLEQTFSDIELILVDDGSSDSTADVLKAVTDYRLRLIKTESNMGACAARNLGIAAAQGEWVAFQDSDDFWHPEKLEKQMAALSNHRADIVFCAMCLVSPDGKEGGVVPNHSCPPGLYNYEKLLEKSIASTQVILGRKECFMSEPFDDQMPRMQDWDLILRLSQKYSIYYLNEVLADVYLQPDSLTMRTDKGLLAYRLIYEKNRHAIECSPRIKSQHIALEGHLTALAGKNPAAFYWNNLSIRYGWKANAKHFIKMLLAISGLLPRFISPTSKRNQN